MKLTVIFFVPPLPSSYYTPFSSCLVKTKACENNSNQIQIHSEGLFGTGMVQSSIRIGIEFSELYSPMQEREIIVAQACLSSLTHNYSVQTAIFVEVCHYPITPPLGNVPRD